MMFVHDLFSKLQVVKLEDKFKRSAKLYKPYNNNVILFHLFAKLFRLYKIVH